MEVMEVGIADAQVVIRACRSVAVEAYHLKEVSQNLNLKRHNKDKQVLKASLIKYSWQTPDPNA